MRKKSKYILWFDEIDKDDLALAGGKGANLGEMYSFRIPVPNGFVVTSKAYFDFLDYNKLSKPIKEILKATNLDDPQTFNIASSKIQSLIRYASIPGEIAREIIFAYLKLGKGLKYAKVAIRSSATAEDLPTASFAGAQKTFLGVRGEANVVDKVKDCWASLFEPRAIFYSQEKGFGQLIVGIAVPIQEMVPAEVSGVMFTIDPVTNQKNRIVIEAIWGLGEYIVQGKVTPDRYVIYGPELKILSREIAKQTIQLIELEDSIKQTAVPKQKQLKRKLNDKQIIELARLANLIHKHYFFPQDIEWVFYKNKFHIVQTRAVTTISETRDSKIITPSVKTIKRQPILTGEAASPGIASGAVKIIFSSKEIAQIQNGDVLVTTMTTPDFIPGMKKTVAIVTDKGGITSHAAIVSRELGVPCVVGTEKATRLLKNNQIITVNGTKGEIYSGGMVVKTKVRPSSPVGKRRKTTELTGANLKTATKVYVNLGEPELAKGIAGKNVDGVGLLRAEFMIANIGTHPKKLIKEHRQNEFVAKIEAGIREFCQAFYPRPVVYRATDFKTNEYRNLKGGEAFEPDELNPLLGYRGAFRYINQPEVFELELQAIKNVRKTLTNLWLMIPFVHTPGELREVKKLVVGNGLIRSPSFNLWLMVELPSNVILLEDFIDIGIDGVSIGSNDLTMLILGIDRDNENLAKIFDERNPAVLWALKKTIKTCQKYKITSSICGQAPSVYSDLVEKLVQWGITSVSVNPDAIERTRESIYNAEEKLVEKR
jgi:pyruvate,water dikinase